MHWPRHGCPGHPDQKQILEEKGKIDILFASAGIVEKVETPAATPEHFDRTFNTNARGVYFTVQKALPLLNDGASVMLTGSGAWQKGMPIYGPTPPPRPLFAPIFGPGRQSLRVEESARTSLYTDGITEAENAAGKGLGQEQLLEWAREGQSKAPGH